MAKSKNQTKEELTPENNQDQLLQQVEELTADLQRTRADFENFRKRMDADRAAARASGEASAILKLLPAIDTIDMAITQIPDNLREDPWVQGIAKISKRLESSLAALNVKKIPAGVGVSFNPDLHEAIQFDEAAEGDKEVIAEELQAGYTLNGSPIRHAMVKVTRQ